jgi:phospholipid/cholesterol/gamma-HCH transport system substrate-binding protein
MARSPKQDLRVGLFFFGLLAVMGGTLFVLGGSTDMLENRYTLNGSWEDVVGLREGAMVRLGGIDVGEVVAVRFSDDVNVREVFVEMRLRERFQERIRKDSEARIETEGVLGDKYISISMGTTAVPPLEDDEWISTRNPINILEQTKKATDLLSSAASIAHKVDLALGREDEAAQASLAGSLAHLEAILGAAKEGEGLVHALVYDKALAQRVKASMNNLEVATAGLRDVSEEIRAGDGLANQLIYGEEGATLARELGDLAAALDGLTRDVKNENSLVHALIYDPSKAALLDDLASTAAALRTTSEAIAAGEGTAGLFARDPALYQDLRALVGGAQRNKLLRAYIRATVQRGERANAGAWEPVE